MRSDLYGESMSLANRLRGMRECLAYIRQEALAYRLHGVADCLDAACDEIDAGIEDLSLSPTSIIDGGARRR